MATVLAVRSQNWPQLAAPVGWEEEEEHWDGNSRSKPWKLCLLAGSSAIWVAAYLQALALLCGWRFPALQAIWVWMAADLWQQKIELCQNE